MRLEINESLRPNIKEVAVEAKAGLREEPGIDQKARVVREVEVGAKVEIVRRVFQQKRRAKSNVKTILN